MSIPAPHFLLFSDSKSDRRQGDWRFVLQSVDGAEKLEVEDAEPEIRGERLELLAVVRGLEALEQPSRVTLITASKYVSRGLADGLQDWRENDWQWENHGAMVPIKNRDLWQRLDRALAFHRLECRAWRVDSAEPAMRSRSLESEAPRRQTSREMALPANSEPIVRSHTATKRRTEPAAEHNASRRVPTPRGISPTRTAAGSDSARKKRRRLLTCRRLLLDWLEAGWLRLAQCGTALLPKPWLQ
jgi:ribonuclease HI